MFGEGFDLGYYQQRHTELLQEAEHARLIRLLEAIRHAEQDGAGQVRLDKWVLAAAGDQLVRLGSKMQRAALSAR